MSESEPDHYVFSADEAPQIIEELQKRKRERDAGECLSLQPDPYGDGSDEHREQEESEWSNGERHRVYDLSMRGMPFEY